MTTQQRISAGIDALTALGESMDQHHGNAATVVPISWWEDLVATARECFEDLIESEAQDITERRAA